MTFTVEFPKKQEHESLYDPLGLLKNDAKAQKLIKDKLKFYDFNSFEEVDLADKSARELRSFIVDLSMEKIEEINPHMTSIDRLVLQRMLALEFQSKSLYSINAKIFTIFSFNEFSAQDTYETYGAYLNAHAERDYNSVLDFKYNTYSHTSDIFQRLDIAEAFMLTEDKTPELRLLIESLTKEHIGFLIQNRKISLNSDYEQALKTIHSSLVTEQNLKSKEDISNELYSFAAKVIGATSYTSKYNFRNIFNSVQQAITNFSARRLKDDPLVVSERDCTTNEVGEVTRFLNANAHEFNLNEAETLIYSLEKHCNIVSEFNAKSYIDFLNKVISSKASDEAIIVIKNFIELHRADLSLLRPD